MKPHNTRVVTQYQIQGLCGAHESEFTKRASQDLGDNLKVGDKFAVPTEEGNKEGMLYYVVVCQHTKFVVRTSFTCVWGNEFAAGDGIVKDKYFQRWGNRK